LFWQIHNQEYKASKEKHTNLSAILPHRSSAASHHNRNALQPAGLCQFAGKLRQRFHPLSAGVILASSRFKCQAAPKDLLGHAHLRILSQQRILFSSTKGNSTHFKLAKSFNWKLRDFHVFVLD